MPNTLQIKQFHKYVYAFYGINGVYPLMTPVNVDDIRAATDIAIKQFGDSFCGDSVDRERVRDILLEQFGYNWATH